MQIISSYIKDVFTCNVPMANRTLHAVSCMTTNNQYPRQTNTTYVLRVYSLLHNDSVTIANCAQLGTTISLKTTNSGTHFHETSRIHITQSDILFSTYSQHVGPSSSCAQGDSNAETKARIPTHDVAKLRKPKSHTYLVCGVKELT